MHSRTPPLPHPSTFKHHPPNQMTHPFITFLTSVVFLTAAVHADSLTPFRSCLSLEQYYIRNAVHRVGPFGLNYQCGGFFSRGGPDVLSFADSPVATTSALGAPAAPEPGVDFSETNVQVEGVDEADVVKTDGKRVFVLRRGGFFVVSVGADGSSGKLEGGLKLPTYGQEMLFQGDYVLVISNEYGELAPADKSFFPSFRGQITVLYQIRVAGTIPTLVSTLRVQGRYVSSREVDGIARIVMTFDASNHIKFSSPKGKVTQQQSTELNKNILRKTTYKDWMPNYHLVEKKCVGKSCRTTSSTGQIASCMNVFRPAKEFGGFELLTVATVAISGSLKPVNSVAISSEGQEVYSTATSLYVTTSEYQGDFTGIENEASSGPLFKTSLHKFGLLVSGARYIASGEVSGSVLNQFSMHEYKGNFFVATTEGSRWWNNRDTSKSKVTSFRVDTRARALKKAGEVGNLGVGERIYSVRYIEDTVYVVTFRQVDPLYIVDLSNVASLKVTGELKIPGYSAYLHPIAPGRILGVGRDATDEGRTTGAKATLFDVSNKSKPRELASWTLDGSYTSAEWDHRAFLYWKPEAVAVLPVNVYGKERFSGSIVLQVSDKGISERGRLSHMPCCGSKSPGSIDRNLVLGKIFLWSLSWNQLQVNNIQDLKFKSKVLLKN